MSESIWRISFAAQWLQLRLTLTISISHSQGPSCNAHTFVPSSSPSGLPVFRQRALMKFWALQTLSIVGYLQQIGLLPLFSCHASTCNAFWGVFPVYTACCKAGIARAAWGSRRIHTLIQQKVQRAKVEPTYELVGEIFQNVEKLTRRCHHWDWLEDNKLGKSSMVSECKIT